MSLFEKQYYDVFFQERKKNAFDCNWLYFQVI